MSDTASLKAYFSLTSTVSEGAGLATGIKQLLTKEYTIEDFTISFNKPVDYKGQPQHETSGGQFSFRVKELVGDDIIEWSQKSSKLQNGYVRFASHDGKTIMKIDFKDSACVSLTGKVNMFSGAETLIVVSSSEITVYDDIFYDGHWKTEKFR